jgi:chromosome segregation ATPase
MKQEIAQLQDLNKFLQGDIKALTADNTLVRGIIDTLNNENSELNGKIDALNMSLTNLQNSEKEIKSLVDKLTEKIQAVGNLELKNQVKKLDQLHADTHIDIEVLSERLKTMESSLKLAPISGIFTYIDKKDDQSLFIEKVQEALAQEMTYGQIDDYLTNSLPVELDKIIKDHPALTRNYIRNLRRE